MADGTQQHGSPSAQGSGHAPVVTDPEHDIDARSAAIWFAVGALAVFFCLWIMVPIFTRVQEAHRVEQKPYGDLPPPIAELEAVKQHEMEFLNGANPATMSIEQAMEKMAHK